MSKHSIKQLCLFCMLVVCSVVAQQESGGQVQSGQGAPQFNNAVPGLVDFDNKPVILSNYADKKKSVVYFWTAATAQELRETLIPAFAQRQDAVLLAVAIFDQDDPQYQKTQNVIKSLTQQDRYSRSIRFLKDLRLKLHDIYTGETRRKAPRSAVVIDPNGTVIATRFGAERERDLSDWLDQHVRDPYQGVQLMSLPPDAQVLVDGEPRQPELRAYPSASPFYFLSLGKRDKEYHIEIRPAEKDEDYLPQSFPSVRIAKIGDNEKLEVKLPRKPRLLVRVEPSDAEIEVQGVTYQELDKQDDKRVIRVDEPGTFTIVARVEHRKEEEPLEAVSHVTLSPNDEKNEDLTLPALIRMRVEEPKEARVVIDPQPINYKKEVHPLAYIHRFYVLPETKYAITASADGYMPHTEQVIPPPQEVYTSSVPFVCPLLKCSSRSTI